MDRSIQRDRSTSPARSLFSRLSRPVTPIRTLASPPLTHEEAEELISPYQYHSGYTYANSLLYRDSMADSDVYEIPNLARGLDRPRYTTVKLIKRVTVWERIWIFLQSFASFLWSSTASTTALIGFLLKLLLTILSIPVYILVLGFIYPVYLITRYAIWKTHFVCWKIVSAIGIVKRHVHFSDLDTIKDHGFVSRYIEYYSGWGFVEGLINLLWEAAGPSKPWSFIEPFTVLIDDALTTTTFFPAPFRDYFFRWRSGFERQKILPNKLAAKLLEYTDEIRSKSLLSSTNGHPNAHRSKIEIDQTIVVSNGSPIKRHTITGSSSAMREEIENTRSLRNRTPVKAGQEPDNLTTTPTRRGRPRRNVTRRVGDTDDEGFESGTEKNSQREAFSKWSNERNRQQLGAFFTRIFDSVIYSFKYIKDFVAKFCRITFLLFVWTVEQIWSGFQTIFSPIQNAFYYIFYGKQTTGGYDLRSRYIPTNVGAEDETSANFLKNTEGHALRAYRSTTNTISRGTSSAIGGLSNGAKEAKKKINDWWWILPLILLLLLLFFAARNPQVQEKMQNVRSSMPVALQTAYDKTGNFFQSIWGFFTDCGNKIVNGFKDVLGRGNTFFFNLVTGFTRVITDSMTWLGDKVGACFGWVKTGSTSLFFEAFRFLANSFRSAFDFFQTGLSTVWRWFLSFWVTYGPSGAFGDAFSYSFGTAKTGVLMIKDWIFYIVNFASSTFVTVASGIKAGWEESKSHPTPPPVPKEPVLPYTEDIKKEPLIIDQSRERQISEADIDAKIQRTVASILENQVSTLIEKKIGLLLADIRHDYMSASKNQASQNQAELDSIKAQLKALQDIKVSILELQKTEGTSLDMSSLEAKINAAILKYNSDRTGIPDYALESAGGSVVSTRCSETYPQASRLEKLFNIPLWYSNYGPRTVIQRSSPALVPGECWAFTGGVGFLTIKLARPLRVTSISYEHVAKELTPDGQIQSSPKEMTFFAYKDVNDIQTRVKLGDFLYKDTGDSLQFFDITVDPGFPVEYVELQVDSNYGAPFTCLYRLRIHGKTMGPQTDDDILVHDEL
ncbi:unnamed protein product, partial [Mesorhabditis belari]|uniref:SUN domain-containing protein n=1 Tax=Mesorhabditis belari TaxID=2138241 RepID=A0AAF3ETT9_9BILA